MATDISGDGILDEDITLPGSKTTIGGVIFQDAANIGSGTGNYNTFFAIQDDNDPGGSESGFNSDDKNPLDGTNDEIDPSKTKTVLLSEVPITLVDTDGDGVKEQYYEIRIDLNESNNEPSTLISLDEFKLFASSDGAIESTADLFAQDKKYDMDEAYGADVSVLLSEAGSSGSGTDDYSVLIPVELFDGEDPASTYLYLYVEMGAAGADYEANGGFEEFNIQSAVILEGTKFNDLDSDGVRDEGEEGIGGVTIFIDDNGNGELDDGERSTTTDENGNYRFFGIAEGTYTIDEIEPAGSVQTTGDNETVVVSDSAAAGSVIIVDPIGNHYLLPSVALDKDVSSIEDTDDFGVTGQLDSAGDVINYTIDVTNDGELNLTNVIVSDPSADTVDAVIDGGFNAGDANMDGILNVGETWQYTATQVVTQTDLNTNGDDSEDGADGDIDNTASVTATSVRGEVMAEDSADVPLAQLPSLSFDKQIYLVDEAGNGVLDHAGETIQYKLVVTNTGNVTLTNVTITDPLTGTEENIGTLEPGETATVDSSYSITQGDIDDNGGGDGDIDNTATAISDQTAAIDDSETVPLLRSPAIKIDKVVTSVDAAGDGVLNAADEIITYDLIVTNIGNTTLTGVTVVDPLTGTDVLIGELAPAESETVATEYAITQADLDNNGGGDGDIDNIATADSNETEEVSDDEDVPLVQAPELTIQKTVIDINGLGPTGKITAAGDEVTYIVRVTNNGNITLTGVTVVDPLTGLSVSDVVLAPTEFADYETTYIAKQSDLDTNGGGDGDVDNTATADSDQTDEVSDSKEVPLIQMPSIAIDKTVLDVGGDGADGVVDEVGDIITYNVRVTNNGNLTLTDVTVVDPLTGLAISGVTLAPGEFADYETTYEATADDFENNGGGDGDIDNTATADSEQTDEVSDSEEVTLVRNPSITIDKTVLDVGGDGPDGVVDEAGDIITYNVRVTNNGNITLTNVTVIDPLTGMEIVGVTLAPGEFADYETTYEATQDDINDNGGGDGDIDNTATADSEQTDEVSDSEEVTLVRNPSIAIDKTVLDVGGDGPDGVVDEAGDIITYNVRITNNGNVTLTDVTVVDPLTGLAIEGVTLQPGEFADYETTYEATQDDINDNGGDDGDIDNTATADSNETDEVSDSEEVTLIRDPSIAIDKTVLDVGGDGPDGKVDEAGDIITYNVRVTNNGNVTLTDVTVVDPLTGLAIEGVTLQPGEFADYETTYEATQDDINDNGGGDGDIDNTATADSNETDEVSDSEDVTLVRNPNLIIDKTVLDVGGDGPDGTVDEAGDIITYNVRITNDGNVTLTNVTVVDPLTGLAIEGVTLQPGEFADYETTYEATQDDINDNGGGDGDIDNTATANSDETDEVSDSEDVPILYNPLIDIEKGVSLDGITFVDADEPMGPMATMNEPVFFQITLVNTGNTTLTGVTITDLLFDYASGTDSALDLSVLSLVESDGVNDGIVGGDGVLDVGESFTLTYSLPFESGQHTNTATVITNEGATDSDAANYYGLINEGPGVRTPGFWQNMNNGGLFWDGIEGNEPHEGDNFPDGELVYAVDSNNDGIAGGEGDEQGLLIGDYNQNGLADAGEDVIFVALNDAQSLINASNKQGNDGVYKIGRDTVATWLNYLSGNNIGDASDTNSAQHYLNDAVDWLQSFAGENGGRSFDSSELFDTYSYISRVRSRDSEWKDAQGDGTELDHSAKDIHNALGGYNENGIIGGVEYAGDADNLAFAFALEQVEGDDGADGAGTSATTQDQMPLATELYIA